MVTSCVQLRSALGGRVDGVERAAAGGACWRGPSWAWPPGQSGKGQGSGQGWPGLLLGARRVDTSWYSHSHLPHLPPQLSVFSRSELAQQTLPCWDLVTLGGPDLCTAATAWMEAEGKDINRKMQGAPELPDEST